MRGLPGDGSEEQHETRPPVLLVLLRLVPRERGVLPAVLPLLCVEHGQRADPADRLGVEPVYVRGSGRQGSTVVAPPGLAPRDPPRDRVPPGILHALHPRRLRHGHSLHAGLLPV